MTKVINIFLSLVLLISASAYACKLKQYNIYLIPDAKAKSTIINFNKII